MKFVIIAIIALIILTIIAFMFRRKHSSEISKLEHDKLQIQHKPIFEEMTKIKQLNMTGETEEKFERWRIEWTKVIDIHMPEIDVLLFDAEDSVDRFRYGKATKIEQEIKTKIDVCRTKMDEILNELNELVGSEEKNRNEMGILQDQYRSARKKVLAHQHSFGLTVDPLEKELESFNPRFEEYDELTLNGNYLQAREIVLLLMKKGDVLFSLIEQLPTLLTQLQNKIPASVHELRNGMKEMEEQSYFIQHLGIKGQLDLIEEKLEKMIANIGKLEMDNIQEETVAINTQIDSFYELLENEVIAKQFVEKNYEQLGEKLSEVISLTKATADEATFVQQSYRLNEDETEIPQIAIDKLDHLNQQYEVLFSRIENKTSANSSLKEELQILSKELDEVSEERDRFAKRLKSLRNDEHVVRTELEELNRRLQDADRALHKGNIPGIPDDMDARLEEAEEHLYVVSQSLQEVPLNMNLVRSYVTNAKQSVDEVSEKVKELLENVMLIEWIIQYGNRYRASNQEIHSRLLEAEESFRQFRYAKALEEAATAVEEVEPGAMKRIEELNQVK